MAHSVAEERCRVEEKRRRAEERWKLYRYAARGVVGVRIGDGILYLKPRKW